MRIRRFFKKAFVCVVAAATIFTSSAVTYLPERSLAAEEDSEGLQGTTISQDENGKLDIERLDWGTESYKEEEKNKWTILVYMCGSDLESEGGSASADLIEMVKATNARGHLGQDSKPSDINVVIQTGGSKEWFLENPDIGDIPTDRIGRYKLISDTEGENTLVDLMEPEENTDEASGDTGDTGDTEESEDTEDTGDTEDPEDTEESEEEDPEESEKPDMANPNTLKDFLLWGVETYPAEHTGVILWNHGGGSLGGVCLDEYSGYMLSLAELDQAFYEVCKSGKMTHKFEFIGFDACLMGTIETANVLAPYAKYMIGSEEVEPETGWDYTAILNYLGENYAKDNTLDQVVKKFGETVCDSYVEHSRPDDTVTLAFYDLSKTDDLIKTTNKAFLTSFDKCERKKLVQAANRADRYYHGEANQIDLLDIFTQLEKLEEEDGKEEVKAAVAKEKEKVKEAIGDNNNNNFVVHFSCGDARKGSSNGVSIVYPLKPEDMLMYVFKPICPMPRYFEWVKELMERSTPGKDVQYKELKEGTLGAESIHFDEDGYLTVRFKNLDEIAFAKGALYFEYEDGGMAYLGATEDVISDKGTHTIKDKFEGKWPSAGGNYLPLTLAFESPVANVYSCPAKVSGESVNLRIEHYLNEESEWKIIGACSETESESGVGVASRIQELGDGVLITPVYDSWAEDGSFDVIEGTPFEYSENLKITYEKLNAGNYFYGFVIHDLYGNEYYTEEVSMEVDENGEIAIDYDHEFSFGDTKKKKDPEDRPSSGGSSSSGGGSSSGEVIPAGTEKPGSTSAADASKFIIEGVENTTLSVANVSDADQQVINRAVTGGLLPGKYSTLELKPVGNYTNGQKVKITVPVEAVSNVKDLRYVNVYRIQDGALVLVAKAVEVKDGKIAFETDHFTAYVFAEASLEDISNPTDTPEDVPEQDVSKEQIVEPLMVKADAAGRKVKLEWNELQDVSGYVVYGGECGKKMKKLKTITNNSTTSWTKKELDPKGVYVFRVKAYKITEDGARKVLVSSPKVSCAMPESGYTNAKNIKTTFTKAVLDAGETSQIEASVKKADEKKKLENSISKLRYISSDKKIATVSKTGKIKAKEKGSCEIYVCAGNGVFKKIKVEVR